MRSPLPNLWHLLGGPPAELDRLHVTGPTDTLRSALPVTAAGTAAVGASLLAATLHTGRPVALDTRGVAVALRSERYLRRDGASAGSPFDPLSAFHRAADGWLRLHANYPWHRAAALCVLNSPDEPDAVRQAIARWPAIELETALHEAGGVGAAVRSEHQWRAEGAPDLPLVERRNLAPAPPRPSGRPLRVLDLTRVIAGPVATRTLAAHGADVLRLDAPDRPEIAMQAWDTLPGKHSALLDLTINQGRLDDLLAGADVIVTGYRPGALDRFGLAPATLAHRHPGLVIVTLSAWGHEGPWAARRGFDSLVQAACGIAALETPSNTQRVAHPSDRFRRTSHSSEGVPGALPAQVLDHATGYLGAAGALLAVADQRRDGGTPHVRLSLLGTAQWLLGLPRTGPSDVPEIDPTPYLQHIDAPDGRLTLATPPGAIDGTSLRWPPPAPSFGTAPAAWPTAGPSGSCSSTAPSQRR